MEIGVYELVFEKDIPAAVAIDEAIEIAKVYGNESSFKFVNGVLSAIVRDRDENIEREVPEGKKRDDGEVIAGDEKIAGGTAE